MCNQISDDLMRSFLANESLESQEQKLLKQKEQQEILTKLFNSVTEKVPVHIDTEVEKINSWK